MAAFEKLLHHYCARSRIGTDALELEAFATREGSALQKAWFCWVQSEAAFRRGDPRIALAWLARSQADGEVLDDPVLAAELMLSVGRCWVALDEPRMAAEPARHAWQSWSSLAAAPSPKVILPSARALLSLLAEPDPPPSLDEDAVVAAWLKDRLVEGFPRAAWQAIAVLADHGRIDLCQEVADTFLGWLDNFVPSGALGILAGLPAARLLLQLADAYDRSGDSPGSLAILDDAAERIRDLPDQPEIIHIRGSLLFNRANQLAKTGRHQEALAEFKTAQGLLVPSGEEALMRCSHAICVQEFKLGNRQGLEERMAELALYYEGIIADERSAAGGPVARQELDRIYRLWLRLLAERFDPTDRMGVLQLMHLVFALKEEDGRFAGLWRRLKGPGDATAVCSQITILLERIGRREKVGLLVVEQAVDALLYVAVGPGRGALSERISLRLIDDEADVRAVTALVERHVDAMQRLCDGSLPIRNAADPSFISTCNGAWALLGPQIVAHITATQTLVVCVDSQTDLRLFPVELLHDGDTYLGLVKDILRAPSLRDLNLLLADNRANADPGGTALVLRADDDLASGNTEASMVERSFRDLGLEPVTLRAPDSTELLDRLGLGVDLLHYVGHGHADEIGETLPLGPGKDIAARELETLHPAPAPMTMLSACHVGRARQLRSGHEQGFVTQLLRRGSPAVIAALHPVPDDLALEFTETFYLFLGSDKAEIALRNARAAFAADGWHPAAWSAFLFHGRAGVSAASPHSSEAMHWPDATLRYLLTGSREHFDAAQRLLADDERVPEASRASIAQKLAMLDCGDADSFQPDHGRTIESLNDMPEATLAVMLIQVFGMIRHADCEDPKERERRINGGIATALEVEAILGDTYVLVATAVEIRSRTFRYLDDLRNTALRASRRLHWLSRETGLDRVRAILSREG